MLDKLLAYVEDHKILISIYVIIHLATYYLAVHVLSKGHLLRHRDPEILARFEPFNRTDVDNWGLIKCLPMILLFWPRIITAFAFFCTHLVWIGIWMLILGGDCGRPTRDVIISTHAYWAARTCLFFTGVYWIKAERVEDADYRKWLGPDWRPQWRGAGTLIANHVCWLDIVMAYGYFFPSFVSKRSVESLPGIKTINSAIDGLFVDRAGNKEEKAAVARAIEERQRENELNSIRRPLLIFPEGATTNNKSVIEFKRGPFSGLYSVQPLGIKYWSLNGISTQNDTILLSHFYYCYLSMCTTIHLKIYPVFKPNDYFWDNHWNKDSGEQQWEAYARVVREEIIAKSFDFKLSKLKMEDKFAFKDALSGGRK